MRADNVIQENKVVNLEKIGVKGFSSEMGLLGPCEHTLKVHRPQPPGFRPQGVRTSYGGTTFSLYDFSRLKLRFWKNIKRLKLFLIKFPIK